MMTNREDIYDNLLNFLHRLNEASIYHSIDQVRPEALMVVVVVPGERWEIEFMNDGTIEVEKYRSNGTIEDETTLADLFE